MRFFALIAAVAAIKVRQEGPSDEDIHHAAQFLGHTIVSVADKNGNGSVDSAEGEAFMNEVGQQIAKYDANGDHEIDGAELSNALEDAIHHLMAHAMAMHANGTASA